MATKKYYHTQNCAAELVADGLSFEFQPYAYMAPSNSRWGIYATENTKEQVALAKIKQVTEIDATEFGICEKQIPKLQDHSTVFTFFQRGMPTEFKGTGAAVTVENPVVSPEAKAPESMADILSTTITKGKV